MIDGEDTDRNCGTAVRTNPSNLTFIRDTVRLQDADPCFSMAPNDTEEIFTDFSICLRAQAIDIHKHAF